MTLAARSSARGAKLQTTLSSWTPLNHPPSNTKVFEERRTLLAKWFDRWSDSQRRAVLQDFVLSCSVEQLRFLSLSVSTRLPLQAADPTCLLPRALCLYIFSFLDPRSLCRCAQVSWHWRSMVELDQLWMPKCVRLGWFFSPAPSEPCVWKRRYIQTVQELRLSSLQAASSQQQFAAPHVSVFSSRHEDPSEAAFVGEERPASNPRPRRSTSRTGLREEKPPAAPPPWRDSDRRPRDTLRFNYLDNLDPGGRAPTAPVRSGASARRSDTREPSVSEAHYKLRKAKALMFLSSNCRRQHPPPPPHHLHHPPPPQHHLHHPPPPPPHHHHLHHPPPLPPPETQSGPSWAPHHHPPVTMEDAKSSLRLVQWNAGIRPGPVRAAVPRLSVEALRAARRSHRSAPSNQSQLHHSSGLSVM